MIVRPGPYICTELDFGGFPAWLLRMPGMRVRSFDPCLLEAGDRYMKRVGRELTPLRVTRGGPIVMVQVESEYGSFDKVGDSFLDTRELGKGHAWINGRHPGRYWSIGPQQTLYLPGVWLKPGRNEVVVLEMESGNSQALQGLADPVFSTRPGADKPKPKP